METPLFFKNNNDKLFGIIHIPEAKINKLVGVVFCHPFAEENLIVHRVLVNLARRLTKEGICCLRFDYMGHGDSDGNFEDSTVETRLSDIQSAADFLKKNARIEKTGLIGVRLGGTLAALTCMNNSNVDFLIIISPVVNGKDYIEQCLRSNLTTQMATYGKITKDRKQLIDEVLTGQLVNIDGYLISKDLYLQIADINLLNNSQITSEHILLVQIVKDEKQPIEKELEQLYLKYKTQGKKVELSHVVEDQFWKDTKIYNPQKKNMQEAVLKWLHKITHE